MRNKRELAARIRDQARWLTHQESYTAEWFRGGLTGKSRPVGFMRLDAGVLLDAFRRELDRFANYDYDAVPIEERAAHIAYHDEPRDDLVAIVAGLEAAIAEMDATGRLR